MKPNNNFPARKFESICRLTAAASKVLDALSLAILDFREDDSMILLRTSYNWWIFTANARADMRTITEETNKVIDSIRNSEVQNEQCM